MDGRFSLSADLFQSLIDDGYLLFKERMTEVNDVKEQIGVADLIERALERGDQMVGELPDETDGVGEKHAVGRSECNQPDRRVERREQPVLNEDVGPRESLQEG